MKFFSVDSPFYRFISRLWDILQVNFFWVIFSIPIVTMGASTAAAFRICLKMTDDEEGYIGREFLKGWKQNLKQGTILELLTAVAFYAVYLDFQFFEGIEGNPVAFLIIGVVSAFFFVLCLLYAWPLIARYQNTLPVTIRNSYRIAMRYFGRTLLLCVVLAVELFVWFYNMTTLFVGVLIGPACMIYTVAGMSLRIFQEIEKEM